MSEPEISMKQIAIVGAGQGGLQAAASLRDGGYDGRLILIGDEPGLPYQRPPLSKAYLLGKMGDEDIVLRDPDFFTEYKIELEAETTVSAIERAERRLRLQSGAAIGYDHLILATGARNRALSVPGAGLEGVVSIRTLADTRRLQDLMTSAKTAVVVGGGFIGLEFAAVAAAQGLKVIVVETAPRPLGRALSSEMSRYFTEAHIGWGVDFIFGAAVEEVLGQGRVTGVRLTNGLRIDADIVVVGIGVLPNQELAAMSGLTVGNGVAVDAHLLTSDPAISALGDVAEHANPYSVVGRVRVESVQSAVDQARNIAARLTGNAKPYDALPWFWSDQGPLKLQMAGLAAGHDIAVVRGDPGSGGFSVFCFKDDRLLAVESVNQPADHMAGRRLLTTGAAITPAQAGDMDLPLKALLNMPPR
jgi:3-phenylpropionate/trans-cinnamate dioxygenase ferredoxin reductase subunit